MEVPTVMNSFVIGLLLLLTSIPATETSKLRITRLPNGPELSSPAVVGTGQTLTIYCVAVTTDSPGTVQGLHWKFPNNSRVPDVRQLSEYDVGMASYLENNTWIGLLRMNRVQLSIAGIYKCVANFSGMPKNRSMEIQVSAFDCGEPDTLTNGRLRLSNSTTVTYTCNSGYRLHGASTRHCTSRRWWSWSVPQCIPIKCVLPPRPHVHGRLNGTGLTFGSTLTYSCKAGYTLNGNSTITCMANRQWSGKAPDCSPVSCGPAPDAPENGQRSGSGRILTSTVTYTCDSGYTLQGDNTRQLGCWDAGTTPQDRRKGVVYEVPCKECDKRYIGETKRTLKVRLGEHKQAVKRGDPKNGIAVHTHVSNHTIDWDEAKVRISVSGYWQRRATEAIFIKKSGETMNLDSGLQLPTMWNPILDPP